MNKYEKAFDVIDTILHLMCGEEREDDYKPSHDEMVNSMENFKELVERATPMQPEFNHDEDTYECPCCGKTYETYYDGYLKKFCSDCGQALDWSENL